MNYELFKKAVVEKFLSFMPEEYRGFKIDIHPVNKINQTLDALSLVMDNGEPYRATPNLYINYMHEHYLECENLEKVLAESAVAMSEAMKRSTEIIDATYLDNVKNNLVMVLVNTEWSSEMLKNVPSRQFMDLSIIYRWIVSEDESGFKSAIVNNDFAEKLEMTEEQLYRAAVENTTRLFPPTVKSMDDVIRDMFIKDGVPSEIAGNMIGDNLAENMMYVISNEKGINGASSILCDDCLHGLAEKLGTDLYILPSSIHEVIAVSINMGSPNDLAQMVICVNAESVSIEDRLSNEVYRYDKDLRSFTRTINNLQGVGQ